MLHLRFFPAWIFSVAFAVGATAQCPPPFAILGGSNQVQLTWQGLARLQTASTLRGPWLDLTTNTLGPYILSSTGAAAFFRLAIAPQEVNHEGILFYNASTGSGAIGEILTNQFISRKSFPGGFSPGWTHITQVPGAGGIMFFYNAASGVGSYGYMSADNFATFETISGFAPWTHVEGIVKDGASLLFFYNAASGNIAYGNSYDTLATNWTHIVHARRSNLVLFYRASDGSGMLDFSPSLTNLSAGSLPTGATHVATLPRPAGGDYVLFYTRTNGAGVFGALDAGGFYATITYGPGSFGSWTHVLGLDDQNFFFYNAGTGGAAIGAMLNDTNFVTTRVYPAGTFSTGWSNIVRADLATMMQAFCWPESAAPGQTIDFFTSTGAGTYSASYARLLNQATQSVNFATVMQNGELVEQVMCGPFTSAGLLQNTAHSPVEGCADWSKSFQLTVPADWASGIYAAKLVDSAGSTTYVPFVVNAPATNHGDFLLIANTTTWNTYNYWGGYSRYEVPGPGAWQFSYLRPNPRNLNPSTLDGDYQYHSKHLTRGELWIQNWLRGAGYRVDVATDLDLHAGIAGLNAYKGLILSTHPEYFSTNMFNAITNYLAQGGHLIYLAANGLYDAVDFSGDLKSLTVYGTSGAGRTHLFRELVPPRPESTVLGIAYPWSLSCGDGANLPGSRVAYQVMNAAHPFFAGTGLTNGSQFGATGWSVNEGGSTLADGGASGWEVDVIDTNSPPGVQLLAQGTNPYTLNCSPYLNVPMAANMVYYNHPGGGFVFSVGSMTFGGSLVVDDKIQRIVRNALDACLP